VQGSYWELIFEQEAYFHGDAILCNFVALHNDFLFFIQAPSMLLIVFETNCIFEVLIGRRADLGCFGDAHYSESPWFFSC
jgi:hypothetical protein